MDRLLYFTLGVLGAMMLLWLQNLLSRLLPKPPEKLAELEAEVWRATFEGDHYGDSDIDRFDMALARAELEKPGSTVRLSYDSIPAVFGRQIGSLAVSFIVAGWFLGILPIGIGTIAVLIIAVAALLYPFTSWILSRPHR